MVYVFKFVSSDNWRINASIRTFVTLNGSTLLLRYCTTTYICVVYQLLLLFYCIMGKKKAVPSSKINKTKKSRSTNWKGSGNTHNKLLAKLASKQVLKRQAQEEHDDFRAEQLNLWQRHHKSEVIQHGINNGNANGSNKVRRKSLFQPKDAHFQPSNEVILSHGLDSHVQLGSKGSDRDRGRGNINDNINSNGNHPNNPNPLQSLASQYRREENEIIRNQQNMLIEEEKVKGRNSFAALNFLGENDDSSSSLSDDGNEFKQPNNTKFQFAPASFTFASSSSSPQSQKTLPISKTKQSWTHPDQKNLQQLKRESFVDPDPDL